MEKIFYGWVPNLSGDIYLHDPFTARKKFTPYSNLMECIPQGVKDEISGDSRAFYRKKYLSDNPSDKDEVTLFIYITSSSQFHQLTRVLLLSKSKHTYELVADTKVQILDKYGLVKFDLSSKREDLLEGDKFARDFINQIYVDVRDTYHEHTHHDGDMGSSADCLLPISYSSDEINAVAEIIANYKRKILEYHKKLKVYTKTNEKSNVIQVSIDSIRQAKGELLYALSFLNYYASKIQDHPDKRNQFAQDRSVFLNAIRSIDTFSDEINTKYIFLSTETQKKHGWYLCILTVCLCILTVFLVALTLVLIFPNYFLK